MDHINPYKKMITFQCHSKLFGFFCSFVSFFSCSSDGLIFLLPFCGYLMGRFFCHLFDFVVLKLIDAVPFANDDDRVWLLDNHKVTSEQFSLFWQTEKKKMKINGISGLVLSLIFCFLGVVLAKTLLLDVMALFFVVGVCLSSLVTMVIFWNTPKPYFEQTSYPPHQKVFDEMMRRNIEDSNPLLPWTSAGNARRVSSMYHSL